MFDKMIIDEKFQPINGIVNGYQSLRNSIDYIIQIYPNIEFYIKRSRRIEI
ncbi:hypothetical protein GCM10027051_29530 [Niabella terrae]